MGVKTRIDWCDSTWNPVTGCLHGCEYCYARRIAERFGGGFNYSESIENGKYNLEKTRTYPDGSIHELNSEVIGKPYPFYFDPTFHRCRLDEPQRWKKPRNIFVCSMADLFGEWVPDEWIQEVFNACEKAPKHRYLFLTKNPKRYIDLEHKGLLPQKHWYGYTATHDSDLWEFQHADECPCEHLFVSIEPIQYKINPRFSTHCPADWVIVGAETGNRKEKVVPKKEWITDIVTACEYGGRPMFMKESLRDLMGDDFRQEFPWEVEP